MRIAMIGLSMALLAGSVPAQAPTAYIDVFVVKVKPEKRAEFDAVIRKIVDANRKHKGDTWIAWETVFGEGNTIYFVSPRSGFADVEKAASSFMRAMQKAYGPAAVKLMQEFNATVVSTREEIRRRRPELSSNFPTATDASALNRLLGDSRWLRTTIVRVRPGHTSEYEAMLAEAKTARERSSDKSPMSVTQSAAGQVGTVFYITTLKSSLGGFDSTLPLPQVLGASGYRNYQKVAAEALLGTETIINRAAPELSNPPEEVIAIAPQFWTPKPPAPAAKPKPATDGPGAGTK